VIPSLLSQTHHLHLSPPLLHTTSASALFWVPGSTTASFSAHLLFFSTAPLLPLSLHRAAHCLTAASPFCLRAPRSLASHMPSALPRSFHTSALLPALFAPHACTAHTSPAASFTGPHPCTSGGCHILPHLHTFHLHTALHLLTTHLHRCTGTTPAPGFDSYPTHRGPHPCSYSYSFCTTGATATSPHTYPTTYCLPSWVTYCTCLGSCPLPLLLDSLTVTPTATCTHTPAPHWVFCLHCTHTLTWGWGGERRWKEVSRERLLLHWSPPCLLPGFTFTPPHTALLTCHHLPYTTWTELHLPHSPTLG